MSKVAIPRIRRAPAGLTPRQHACLEVLREHGAVLTSGEVDRAAGSPRGGSTGTLKSLHRRGLVETVGTAHDPVHGKPTSLWRAATGEGDAGEPLHRPQWNRRKTATQRHFEPGARIRIPLNGQSLVALTPEVVEVTVPGYVDGVAVPFVWPTPSPEPLRMTVEEAEAALSTALGRPVVLVYQDSEWAVVDRTAVATALENLRSAAEALALQIS